MIDLDELEKLAKTATPGSWSIDTDCLKARDRLYVAKGSPENLRGRILEVFQNCLVHESQRQANAEFIAAANPTTILELIAEVRALRAEVNDFTTSYGDMNQEVVRLREDLQAAKLLAHANGEMFRAERERVRECIWMLDKYTIGEISYPEFCAAFAAYRKEKAPADSSGA